MSKRYEVNPFMENMFIPRRNKQVRIFPIGDNRAIVDTETGEVTRGGGMHGVIYKQVDGQEFVKIFTKNIKLMFDLTGAGYKAFYVLMWAVQNDAIAKDEVGLDSVTLDRFLKSEVDATRTSIPTFQRGLAELEKAQIIAKTLRKGFYFINPNFIFNGDRMAFTTLFEKRKTTRKQERINENQLALGFTDVQE